MFRDHQKRKLVFDKSVHNSYNTLGKSCTYFITLVIPTKRENEHFDHTTEIRLFLFLFLASSAFNPLDQRKMWQLRASQTLIKTLLTFVITFAVCWAPNQVVFLGYNLGLDVDFASPVYHVGNILAVCNSCVNPIIYTMTNQPFRKGIREAFCRKSRRWVTPSV